MTNQQAISHLENMKWLKGYDNTSVGGVPLADIICDIIAILLEQEHVKPIVRCKDCKHWDKTTREEGNDCILGPWEDAVCDVFRDWDSYGDLGENFRRTNGNWFCADGERR